MFVIGTAGHVDHGKSTLVWALTGTHPDRLREEQERGLTIELGFGWCTLPSGREVSVVDVPGHVRFVRHMLAGIGAVDLALLVIAADEGVMPQTREHLEILELLGVTRGVVALTKCDLPDPEWLDLVEEEVRAALAESPAAADWPLVRVAARDGAGDGTGDGAGVEALRAALDRALDGAPPPRDTGHPRLGIDRVFTMPGFGTVVTGTLRDGVLRVGDALAAVPGDTGGRVRGLQTHGRPVEVARPGTRVAVNLAGVRSGELARGQVLAAPGWLRPATVLDVRVRALPERPLRHNLRVTVHLGVDEVQARLRVLAPPAAGDAGRGGTIGGGAEGWAQLVLARPVATLPGDRLVLRVSDRTLGGGTVVRLDPPRHRPTDPALPALLARLAAGTPESRVLALLSRIEPATAAEVATAVAAEGEVTAAAAEAALAALVARGEVWCSAPHARPGARAAGSGPRSGTDARGARDGRDGGAPGGEADGGDADGGDADALYLTGAGRERLAAQVGAMLAAYHREHPLRVGMPVGDLRGRLALPPERVGRVLALLAPEVEVAAPPPLAPAGPGILRARAWTPRLSAAQRQAVEALAARLRDAALQPPRMTDEDPEIVRHLVETGRAVDLGDEVVMDPGAVRAAAARVVALLRPPGAPPSEASDTEHASGASGADHASGASGADHASGASHTEHASGASGADHARGASHTEQARGASGVSLAELRDALGTNRRVAQAIAERLDALGVTERRGDARVAGPAAAPLGDTAGGTPNAAGER